MKNAVTKTESKEVTTVSNEILNSDWGDVVIESKDLVLPKLIIQQAMSDAVKAKTAQEGDIVNTLTSENVGTEIELIPFYKTEQIVIEKWNGKKFVFYKIIPYEGKTLPFEEEIDGVRYKNSNMYNIFCLTKDLIIPHILSFKGTSYKTGKQLVSMMYISNKAEGLSPAGKAINFTSKPETSKGGDTYVVAAFTVKERTTQEQQQECLKWIKTLRTTNFATHEEKEENTPVVESNVF